MDTLFEQEQYGKVSFWIYEGKMFEKRGKWRIYGNTKFGNYEIKVGMASFIHRKFRENINVTFISQ